MPAAIPVVFAVASTAASAAGAAGIGLLGTQIVGSLTIGTLVGVGLSLVGGLVTNLVTNNAARRNQGRVDPQSLQATLTDPTGPRFFCHGRVLRGGRLVFWEVAPGGGGEVLWRVIVTDCQPTEAIEQRRLNNDLVTLSADGVTVEAPAQFLNVVQIHNRLGASPETAVASLSAEVPSWTADHRGDGLTYVAIRQAPVPAAEVNDRYPNGAQGEVYTELVRAGSLYDPRLEASAWSRNGALALLWALTLPQYGALDLGQFSLDTWAAAADEAARTFVDGDGVGQFQYGLSGVVAAPKPGARAQEVATTVREYLESIDGTLYDDPDNDGKVGLQIGVAMSDPRPPLTADQVISFQDENGLGLEANYDGVRVEYTEPNFGYQSNITQAFGLKDGVLGFIEKSAALNILTVQLFAIDRLDHARRIAKKLYLRVAATRATAEVNLAGVLYRQGDVVTFNLPHLEAGTLWRVTGREIEIGAEEASTVLSLESVHPEYMTPPPPVPNPAPAAITSADAPDAPQCLRAAASDGAGAVRVSWDAPEGNQNVPIVIEAADAGASPVAYTEEFTLNPQSQNVQSLEIDLASFTGNANIKARFDNGAGVVSSEAEILGVDRLSLVAAPAAPTLALLSGDRQTVRVRVTVPSDPSLWKVELYYAETEVTEGGSEVPGAAVLSRSVNVCSAGQVEVDWTLPSAQGGATQTQLFTLTARTVNLSGARGPASGPVVYFAGGGNEA